MKTAVAKPAELGPGSMRIVEAGGLRIALCNVEGRLYAIEDRCSHDDGPLGEGTLLGDRVQCPRHGALFDVRSGAALRMPAVAPVRVFPVSVEGDRVFIEVSDGL